MNETFPRWNELTPESVSSEMPALLASAEAAVAAVERGDSARYEDFVWPLDDALRDITLAWKQIRHMLGVMNSPEWRNVEEAFRGRVVAFALRVAQSRRIYERARAVRGAVSDGDPDAATRRRILDRLVLSAELAGVGLDGAAKARFNEIKTRLATLSADFANSVVDATAAYKFEKGGRTYTIDDAEYPQTMRKCEDREVREALCRARMTRAPENAARISEILSLRAEMASILGFGSYAELSLADKCAPSVSAVDGMIDSLDVSTAARAAEEDGELSSFFASKYGVRRLEAWDVEFAAERLREEMYSYSDEELKKFFPLESVLKGAFKMASLLFGVDVEEAVGDAKPQTWHKDVRFFSVKERGATIAHFYFDPYVRSGLKRGGAWMNDFSNRCDRLSLKPLAVIVMNAPAPDADGVSFLPFRQVETLFHEFGHALQCMLTRVGEEGASGINLVEWDAVEVASQFMENWCLDDRTGIAVPQELKAKVKASKNFRAAAACRRQLAFTKTDMDLHRGLVADPDGVKRGNFAHFGLRCVDGDLSLNSFQHIFAGAYAAGYYGYKWSEVMSADCYGAFEEAGLSDDAAVRAIGAKYRETVLALGGGESAYDVFMRFRGRPPSPDALLRQTGLGAGDEKRIPG